MRTQQSHYCHLHRILQGLHLIWHRERQPSLISPSWSIWRPLSGFMNCILQGHYEWMKLGMTSKFLSCERLVRPISSTNLVQEELWIKVGSWAPGPAGSRGAAAGGNLWRFPSGSWPHDGSGGWQALALETQARVVRTEKGKACTQWLTPGSVFQDFNSRFRLRLAHVP